MKLLALVLCGAVLLQAAAATDVAPQKKYKKETEKYDSGDYAAYAKKGHSHARHVAFTVTEHFSKVFPCDADAEILGANVAANSIVMFGGEPVGRVFWSGIVVDVAKDGDQKNVTINYACNFKFDHKKYAGTITGAGLSNSIFSSDPATLAVTGGTGAFEGASGTFTWTSAKGISAEAPDGTTPAKYALNLWIPRRHEGDDSYYAEEDGKY